MEEFLNHLTEKIKARRAAFEAEGVTGEDLTDMTARWFNSLMERYYGKLMELMTEDDFQAYKRALDRQDAEAFRAVMAKYQAEISTLQKEILEEAV